MKSKKKLLMLSPQIPRRCGTGGEVRAYHYYRTLTENFILTLIVLREIDDPQIYDNLRRTCKELITPKTLENNNTRKASRAVNWNKTAITLLFPPARDYTNYWDLLSYHLENAEILNNKRGIFRKLIFLLLKTELYFLGKHSRIHPLSTHYLYKNYRPLKQKFADLCQSEHFDVLWIEHTFAYPIAKDIFNSFQRPFTVCVAHNIESDLFKQYAKISKEPNRKFFLKQQINILHRLETETFKECDLIFVCSEVDKLKAELLAPKTFFALAPNGVDIDLFRNENQNAGLTKNPQILFTGGMNYPPNKDAVRYFLKEIFSKILKEIPTCEFIIAGRHAQSTFKNYSLGGQPIRIVSDPVDIRPVFKKANIFVVPLRIGGGTRLKILEAMAMGCPVVSTKIGAEGVPYTEGKHLLLADNAEDFANKVVLLLQNQVLRSKLLQNAKLWVKKHYSWNVICQRAVDHLMNRLEQHC